MNPAGDLMVGRRQSALCSGLSFTAFRRAVGWVPTADLSAAESASTLFRFFRSKHVRDLKLICAVALSVFVVHILLVLAFGMVNWWLASKGFLDSASAFFSFLIEYVGPAVPIYGLIIGWAYQSASKRLGIVDLFACEIGTLCRVGTIFDIAKRYVDGFDNRLPEKGEWPGSGKFVSEEEYFPVFDTNSRDLQLLEASVVENITAFYTYMKALRDTQRRLAETKPPQVADPGVQAAEMKKNPWHAAIANVIYLLYLGYESARKAIEGLVEFQPAAAERLIVILLTELKCYSFLLKYYQDDDVRYRRLKLREQDYKQEVPELYRTVMSSHGKNQKDWLPAMETVSELAKRYEEALGESVAEAVFRSERGRREVPDSAAARGGRIPIGF